MARTCKDAIREALVHLGGEGTTEEVRNYIHRKYGSKWKDNTITTLMADLTYPGNPSSTIPMNKRFLKKVGPQRYRLREKEEMKRSSSTKAIYPRIKKNLSNRKETEIVSEGEISGMLDFDNTREFKLVHHFHVSDIYTWGNRDVDRREEIRRSALKNFPKGPFNYEWYAFRITVRRNVSGRDLDLENVPKLIIDAFSGRQINRDRSEYPEVEIYKDDTIRWVRAIQIDGQFTYKDDHTEVWIFGKK